MNSTSGPFGMNVSIFEIDLIFYEVQVGECKHPIRQQGRADVACFAGGEQIAYRPIQMVSDLGSKLVQLPPKKR